jgi:acyl carrier protein
MNKTLDLKQILSETFKIKKEDITIDTDVNNTRKWDSLAHVNLIVNLEEKLNIKLDAKTASRLISVKEIVRLIKKYGFSPVSDDLN